MNETKWQTGVDGDAMFDFVADRLSPRQWVFLSAAFLRKLWDLLPEGVLRQAVDFAERSEHPLPAAERDSWTEKIDAAVPQEAGAAELARLQTMEADRCFDAAEEVGSVALHGGGMKPADRILVKGKK